MLKIKTKELIICVITIAILMLTLFTDVFATDGFNSLNDMLNDLDNASTINSVNNVTNNNVNNVANNNVNNVVRNNVNSKVNNTTSMPNTGVDYSVVFIIAICGISAIYAYKKIRDYNNF